MTTKMTHMLRIAPATARRLKAYARENSQTMDGGINSLLDAAGFPREHVLDAYTWAGDQEGQERFQAMLEAAEKAGDKLLAAFARKRLRQIADALAGEGEPE
ncbi:MAG: hypothetical protein ACP59X_04365 [Solidesulfovibrio sp. DCME]|uniref:hypothetical protein n=1 Tax=Solidesulfovibrio sp. DCME TaxID=3447380 RepID=UPI003D1289B2